MRYIIISAVLSLVAIEGLAQDHLINSLKDNKSESSKDSFKFTELINIPNSDVKNQGKSGTCWSYCTSSFLESEMLRETGKQVDLADIYPVRCSYIDKADAYVRMHGSLNYGDGGACHDVINMLRKYGALPQSVYSGINYDSEKNNFGEMQSLLTGMLKGVVSNKSGKLSKNWKEAFTNVLDLYLGEVPEKFTFEGKEYTPQSFARNVVKLDPDDYVELSSFSYQPYYQKHILMVPDNWSFDQVYNVHMNEMTDIIDNALKNGYTVAWATDVSEKGFSWKNGVAYVPETDYEDMSKEEKEDMFNGPKPEKNITEEMRQNSFDNYSTTDDHGMHIVGMAKDQNNKEYYLVKNSWGMKNDYEGYLYVTKNYVKYKTTAFLLHKNGLPKDIKKKLGV